MAKTKAKTKTTREVGDSAPKGLTIRSTNPAILSEQIFQLQKMIKSSDEAKEIAYDNTDSGLTADDVQEAIDEIVGDTTPEDFTITAAEGATWSRTIAKVDSNYAKIIANVSLETAMSAGDTVNIGTISDTKVLSKIPQGVTLRTASFYGQDVLCIFISDAGVISARFVSGSTQVSDISFNIVF